ncbi:hypothetical protein [Micromonospora sp. KC721]|uniref:hypothetical protein n=1 Tax=Micromonospora sp. KC721 TaxID=2530380 RepID=UPI00104E0D47|nr:hypothetical protein [Micromonospora sp. KC721]TDB81097.1 hypothetical protein E1182_06290 [Micromonospora sp. KC721]
MFSAEERDTIRQRLLDLAAADPMIVGAAITGSQATGDEDRWSDIDLVFAVDGSLAVTMQGWTDRLYDDFDAAHHWDVPSGSAVYRVFLLPACLEVDIAFTPAAHFAPHGPSWRTVFGNPAQPQPAPLPAPDHLAGLAWHHALHAWISIQRNRLWQAEYWISALRSHVIALTSLRLGHPTSYAKGAHLLPADLTEALHATLVRTLDHAELHRALTAAINALIAELERTDPALANRLFPALAELAGHQPRHAPIHTS